MIEVETRLRVGRGLGKTETEASIELLHQLKRRGHPDAPPPLVSDGWGGHREALIAVYGQVPDYSGRGRPPSLKQPCKAWQYLQMVKQREKGHVIGVEPRVIFGDPEQIDAELDPHTAYVERTNLTSRHMNGRLGRFGKMGCTTWHVMSKPYGWKSMMVHGAGFNAPRRWSLA
jgi:hypothetical protein